MKLLIPLVLCVFLLACQQVAEKQPLPPEPVEPAPPVIAPAEPEAALPETTKQAEPASEVRDAMFATRKDGSKSITADDVLCDLTEETLTFRFRNLDTRSWQLNNEIPLTPPEGLVGMYVMINGYQANDRSEKFVDGKKLFGPNDRFSENCGGVEVLAPGEQAVCTLTSVPLRDVYHAGGVNEILLNVPGAAEDPRVEFTCG